MPIRIGTPMTRSVPSACTSKMICLPASESRPPVPHDTVACVRATDRALPKPFPEDLGPPPGVASRTPRGRAAGSSTPRQRALRGSSGPVSDGIVGRSGRRPRAAFRSEVRSPADRRSPRRRTCRASGRSPAARPRRPGTPGSCRGSPARFPAPTTTAPQPAGWSSSASRRGPRRSVGAIPTAGRRCAPARGGARHRPCRAPSNSGQYRDRRVHVELAPIGEDQCAQRRHRLRRREHTGDRVV